jgi:omega-hydroxy-beta-dihydromenaquinone-9 sulfotransferase
VSPVEDGIPRIPDMRSMLSRIARVGRVLRRQHGLYVRPVLFVLLFAVLRAVVWLGMALDQLFFPALRRKQALRPIVIVGNPRTGTTFLQRFMVAEGFGAGMELFRMLYPSLVLQSALSPLLPLLEKLSPARFHSSAAHHTSLSSVETDDVAVLFRYLDGFFLYGFFLSFDDEDLLPVVDPRVRDTSARDFAWLEQLWRRSLIAHATERNVAKLFSLAPRLPQFLQAFPASQILYMARDPVEVIPSSMSLVIGVLDRALMYQAWILLLRRFHADWTSGAIDQSRVFIVRYDVMMQQFEPMMHAMCQFLGHEMSEAQREAVKEHAEKQRNYASEHRYDLGRFNLSEAQIRRDCSFYYETFLGPIVTHGATHGQSLPLATSRVARG